VGCPRLGWHQSLTHLQDLGKSFLLSGAIKALPLLFQTTGWAVAVAGQAVHKQHAPQQTGRPASLWMQPTLEARRGRRWAVGDVPQGAPEGGGRCCSYEVFCTSCTGLKWSVAKVHADFSTPCHWGATATTAVAGVVHGSSGSAMQATQSRRGGGWPEEIQLVLRHVWPPKDYISRQWLLGTQPWAT
jgi:hypothetical protein